MTVKGEPTAPSDGCTRVSGIWILFRMLNFITRVKFETKGRQKKRHVFERLDKEQEG